MNTNIELLPNVYFRPRTIETERGKIEFDLNETEGPCVLSVHGGIGGADQARVMVSWLDDKKYRLLCPSRPGYLNTPLESGKTIEDQADLLAALLDSLKIEKVAVVCGSAGGPPAYMFAIRHPKRVRALIAVDSISGYYDMPETAGPIAQAIFTSQIGQKILKMIGDAKPEIFLQQIFQSEAYFTKKQIKEHIDYVLKTPKAFSFMKAFMNTMNPYDPRKKGTENDLEEYRKLTHLPVEKITCPSLIIHGTHDADVKFYDGVYAYEHIPNAERYWIEEGSHLSFWFSRYADQAQKVAREFLVRKGV